MSNTAALALLEQRIWAEESIIKSNQAVINNSEALLKKEAEIAARAAERILSLERAIEFERGNVAREQARLHENIALRKIDVQNSEQLLEELKGTLALLRHL